jgi:hypothetical protein
MQILTDALSGYSSEFQLPSGDVEFRLYINGTSANPINAYYSMSNVTNNLYLQVRGITGSGIGVSLQARIAASGNDFSDTGEIWYKDFSGFHHLQNK